MPLAGRSIAFEDPASGRCPLQFNFKNSTVPSLPDFECDHGDQIIGARSQSSADSVRGISITTEQSGGENTSSTTFLSTDINVYQSNKPGKGETFS